MDALDIARLMHETTITFAQAAERLGVKLHTVIRWRNRGERGLKLEAYRPGGRQPGCGWLTSVEAVARFLAARERLRAGHALELGDLPQVTPEQAQRDRARRKAAMKALR